MLFTQVTLKGLSPTNEQRQFWFVFASDHASIADLCGDLIKNGVVTGERLQIEKLTPDRRREERRWEFAIGVDAVMTIQPLQFTLEPPETGKVAAE